MTHKTKSLVVWFALFAFLFTSACAHYPVNQPQTDLGPVQDYIPRLGKRGPDKRDDILLVLAFSGGGTRAASLSYGILRALDKVKLSSANHSLLDEVDTISSVSGGSFTASYFGLKGKEGFPEFEKQFLYHNIQRALLFDLFRPKNWFRLASPWFGRSELAAEYYDKVLFHQAVLGDLLDREEAPNISLMATDIGGGNPIGLNKTIFSIICSDYKTFPVSRAVTASSSFPGAFSSVTLKNYADQCQNALQDEATVLKSDTGRLGNIARIVLRYRDVEETPFIHLQDGGISDNLGLRGPLIAARFNIDLAQRKPELIGKFPEKIIFIIVNAETSSGGILNRFDSTPSTLALLWELFSIFISNYNTETLSLLRASFDEWKRWSENNKKIKKPFDFYTVEINFRDLKGKKRQKHFLGLPTSLGLPKKEVDQLIAVGEELLYQSPDFQKFVKDIGGKMPE